jgi:RNA polymerase sigma-70 factor (ECF subfamily)
LPEQPNIHDSYYQGPGKVPEADALRALIKDCISWNRSSQRQLYETYAPIAYNVIRRYVYNEEAGREILNDSFYKIFTRLEQYNWQGPFEAWMRRIIVNTITDYIRRYVRYEQENKGEVHEEDVWIESDAVSNLSFKELIDYTYKLPDLHRAVFNLNIFEQMSHKEIAQHLQISEGNSRWILNDARKRLKQIILSV